MILGVIPARGGSKGLPGKTLRLVAGVPLIVHTIRAARKSRLLSDFIVSTDDPAIAQVARAEGAKVPFLRPPDLHEDGACIARFLELDAGICVTVFAAHDSPYFNMVEITAESAPYARPCSPAMLKSLRRQEAPCVYVLNGAGDVVPRSGLATLQNQFEVDRFALSEMPRERSVDVDSAEDLAFAEWLLSRAERGA